MELDLLTSNISFDDILLVPKQSGVTSRSDVTLFSKIGNPKNPDAWISMDNPFIIAPMEYISSDAMIEKVLHYGGIGFVSRFQTNDKRFTQLKSILAKPVQSNKLGFAISTLEAQDVDFINTVLSYGVKILLIDTAFGHTDTCIESVKILRSIVPNYIHIMTGNVSSYEAYRDLMDAGADSVRVGIGGGAACTTRFVTGFGVPVLSSIMDIYKNVKNDIINGIISDGAIKQTGDIVKAFAAGASAVMMGSMFAGHDECDGFKDGKFLFRGLASSETQIDNETDENPLPKFFHIEGVSGYVENKGPVEYTINQMINNVKSGFSYCGVSDLQSFRSECTFIKVSPQSLKESGTRV